MEREAHLQVPRPAGLQQFPQYGSVAAILILAVTADETKGVSVATRPFADTGKRWKRTFADGSKTANTASCNSKLAFFILTAFVPSL